MADEKKTRLVRVGHDFVPYRSKDSFLGFRSEGSFSMQMTQEQIDFLLQLRELQVKNGVAGCPVLEIIPEGERHAG